ncbi:hypothetical protein [Litchfieldia salsa]|uniref:Uncharacterized protein n=1 Tax=Litchfieldia salsa TaxID=930152 RepID=A0A1H0X325_9BACI|nr:hypothetical protein [Litchfieldia salsa]SDP97353.1 hypothetical protein SAMN05216565_12811 [Litchfieldia salsa]
MFKARNIIPNMSVVMVLFIIFVSTMPTYIKFVLTIFTISILFPVARKIMLENKLRKMKVAFYTAVIFSLGLIVVPNMEELPPYDLSIISVFLLIFFFSAIGIYCYGIPASIIAELASNRYPKYRAWLSGIIHIVFGLFTAIFGLFDELNAEIFILSSICALLFFLIDEITRRSLEKAHC